MLIMGICLYILIMLGVGFWAGKRVHSLSDFLVAGRSLPFFFAASSLFATWFGAGSCMGAAGTAYSDGILGVISDPIAAGFSLIIAGFFVVHLLRRLELLTVTDIFGIYYSKNSEIFASILMIPVYVGWLGSQMVALGYLANIFLGVDATLGIFIGATIMLIYTFSGGMWAVMLTDLINISILILGLAIIFPITLSHVGGFSVLLEKTPTEFWHFFPQSSGASDWLAYGGQWALLGLGTIVGQDLIQRSLSSKNESVARSSAITAGVAYLIVGAVPILLGFSGRILFPELENPELIIPTLATTYLSPILLVIFIGALISAIMSSSDSALLAATSLATHNVLRRLFPSAIQGRELQITRYMTILTTIIALVTALKAQTIYDLMVNSWATLLVAILVPVMAALYWKKANTLAAWISMITGTSTWLGIIFFGGGSIVTVEDNLYYIAAMLGGLASLASYIIVTLARWNSLTPITPACNK